MKLLALAAALLTPLAAHANDLHDAFAKALPEINKTLPDSLAPEFGCYDPTNKDTCQQARTQFAFGPPEGFYSRFDFANGLRVYCVQPVSGIKTMPYRICVGWDAPDTSSFTAEIFTGKDWVEAPSHDERCVQWGGYFTAEYLACEAALPPKQS
jgi:hypothetical protein